MTDRPYTEFREWRERVDEQLKQIQGKLERLEGKLEGPRAPGTWTEANRATGP